MNAKPVVTIGQDARYAALVTEPSANLGPPVLYDLLYERTFALPFTGFGASFDASSRFLAIATQDALVPVGGDANNVPDIYVVDLRQVFDADADSLDDRWETTFGLSTTAGTGDDGADGPDGDPDGDGITNAQEQNAGTHPRGMHRLYLAEGATGSFFQTRLMLANDPRRTSRNPGASGLAPGLDQVIDLPPNSRTTVEIPSSLLSFKRFATLVEGVGDTPVPLVVEGAFYWSVDGLLWAAGSGVVATPLP